MARLVWEAARFSIGCGTIQSRRTAQFIYQPVLRNIAADVLCKPGNPRKKAGAYRGTADLLCSHHADQPAEPCAARIQPAGLVALSILIYYLFPPARDRSR